MQWIDGGVTAPEGFLAIGGKAGVKKDKNDLSITYSVLPAQAAAVFTKNHVKAAPVLWSQRILEQKQPIHAVVINSGNANACTGREGMEHAILMGETAGKSLGVSADSIFVGSTGVIGVPLPIERVCGGIEAIAPNLSASVEGANLAAEAIMTTDMSIKQAAVEINIDGVPVRVGGMAKGSGMIHPNMATMLAVITTDATIDNQLLQVILGDVVDGSFNMISVDGDTSTNDSVFLLANGASRSPEITQGSESYTVFRNGLESVCQSLAQQIIRDGEGASKFLEVSVSGAKDTVCARLLAKSVITSSLVKTAFFGEDANWGRILAAMGYSGAEFDTEQVTMSFQSNAGRITLMEAGEPIVFDEETAANILHERDILVDIRLGDGEGTAVAWGCDLSYEYVKINGDYRS